MSDYRIAVNVEWTSKCNARCAMCPRELIERPRLMAEHTWQQVLERLSPRDVFRAVIAGYGEPTTHNRFCAFVDRLRDHPVRFDMISNGQQLDAWRLLDGAYWAYAQAPAGGAGTAKAGAELLPLASGAGDLQYSIQFQERVRKLFTGWLSAHIAFSIVFYLLLALHIWAGIYFGLRWFR